MNISTNRPSTHNSNYHLINNENRTYSNSTFFTRSLRLVIALVAVLIVFSLVFFSYSYSYSYQYSFPPDSLHVSSAYIQSLKDTITLYREQAQSRNNTRCHGESGYYDHMRQTVVVEIRTLISLEKALTENNTRKAREILLNDIIPQSVRRENNIDRTLAETESKHNTDTHTSNTKASTNTDNINTSTKSTSNTDTDTGTGTASTNTNTSTKSNTNTNTDTKTTSTNINTNTNTSINTKSTSSNTGTVTTIPTVNTSTGLGVFSPNKTRFPDLPGFHRGSTAASDFNWNGVCGVNNFKCVISFGLYGSAPRYMDGAIENAALVHTIYPGWIVRFYHDTSVPVATLRRLSSLGAELELINGTEQSGGIAGMFWRFLVATDPTVERYLIRDADSRLNLRENSAVQEWIESGYSAHIMRDHPNHRMAMMGGTWGGVRGCIKGLAERINSTDRGKYGVDQYFLREFVWPQIKFDHIAHDSYFCKEKQFPNAHPFPTQRQGFEHVGQVYIDNKPRESDMTKYFPGKPNPPECRKQQEWTWG